MSLTAPTKEITAQDFVAHIAERRRTTFRPGDPEAVRDTSLCTDLTIRAFEELLSQVRQQAFSAGRCKGIREMDDAIEEMQHEQKNGTYRDYQKKLDIVYALRHEFIASEEANGY